MKTAQSLVAFFLACAVCPSAIAQASPGPDVRPPAESTAATSNDRATEAESSGAASEPSERTQEAPEPGAPAASERRRRAPRTFTVTWDSPEPLKALFRQHLHPPADETAERPASSLRPWIRDIRRRVPEMAASEGYFLATVEVDYEDEAHTHVVVKVNPGPRTVVDKVEMEFRGDLAQQDPEREARRGKLREGWALRPGQPFRSADWDTAKTRIAEDLVEEDYAAGELVESRAVVDAEASKATLKLVLDSGPRFTTGDVVISGIQHYNDAIVRRSIDLKTGERYSAKRLQDLQRRLQEGPWFSSAVFEVEPDREHHENVPVKLTVIEKPRVDIGLAVGYGTDDGARMELAYRDRDIFARGFDLQSSLRVSQKQQIGYADLYLPPGLYASPKRGSVPFQDSLGVLVEHSDISNLVYSRIAFAGYRHFKLENFETRVGLSYQVEDSQPQGAQETFKRALAPIVAFTWRHVDNIFDPKRGGVLNLQLAAGSKALASGDDFVKLYGQYQYWIPLNDMNQFLVRGEMGRTFTSDRTRIPEDFLYRAGGARSNRGYAYQSLGVQEGDAIVGGRYMATGTVEYVHWLNEKWGAAAFLDVGDATDATSDWKANPSYGVGARFKTPAGPFAIDLAYALDPHKVRLAFSVTVAF